MNIFYNNFEHIDYVKYQNGDDTLALNDEYIVEYVDGKSFQKFQKIIILLMQKW